MKKHEVIFGLSFILIAPTALGGAFNLHRGDLLDNDKINIEWRKQEGNCPTKFPAQSIDCEYFYANVSGLKAMYIDTFSQHSEFNTENTFLLNVSINGVPVSSCELLQQKITGFSLVTINRENCIIS